MKLSVFLTCSIAANLSVDAYVFPGKNNVKKVKDDMTRRSVLQKAFLSAGALLLPTSAIAAPRPEYLSDPTEEFKESERQRMEFKAAQLKVKKEFTAVLDRLTNESKTEDDLVRDLKDLKSLVSSTGGMPLGIKKEDMVKIIRRKKAQGFWPTNVEIAYQDLFREILFQQSPNKEKDPLSAI